MVRVASLSSCWPSVCGPPGPGATVLSTAGAGAAEQEEWLAPHALCALLPQEHTALVPGLESRHLLFSPETLRIHYLIGSSGTSVILIWKP